MNTLSFTDILQANLPAERRPMSFVEPGYSEVSGALEQLREATYRAFDADVRDAERAVGELRQQHPTMQTTTTQYLADAREEMRAHLDGALAGVTALAEERLRPHAGVPEQLERERDTVREHAAVVEGLLPSLGELVAAEGWQGEAAESYRSAAKVQVSALKEYAGLSHASSNALERAALLNRAASFLAAEEIRFAASGISSHRALGDHLLYSRSQAAIGELRAMRAKVEAALDDAETGPEAQALVNDLEGALDAPALLVDATWPTGGDASGTEPADTAAAIPPPD